ncbi:MAG: inositol monophosphatase [Verrucomicrobiales bacterium]|nr:inositol monophosphatase [Verrucomicrobiales bacterium]
MIPDFFAQHSPSLILAAEAAEAAGAVIRDGYDTVHQVDVKNVGDLVSKVDFDADRAATEILKAEGITIVSEELNPETKDESADMWIVDPLDGTTAYLMKGGRHISSVLVAKRVNGETELGITYFPLTDEWFYAERGKGAWRNGHPLKIDQRSYDLSECWIEMNQYGNQEFETSFFSDMRSALRSPNGAQIVTSTFPHAGVAMRIAEQNVGLAVAIHDNSPASLKQGPWDIAANQVIFEEAGGVFVNPDGKRTNLFNAEPIIIAPNRQLADAVLECYRNWQS